MADAASPTSPLQQEVAVLRQRVAALEAARTAQEARTQALQDAQELAEKVIETIRDPLLILQPDLRVEAANPAFYQLFQVHPADTLGWCIYDLGNGQWAIPALRTLLEDILPSQTVFNDFEVSHTFAQLGPRTMLLNARRVDHLQLILLAIEDITSRKHAETLLRAHAALLGTQVEDQTAALQQALAHLHRESPPASTSNARRSAPSTLPCLGAWRRACRMKFAIPSVPLCSMWTCWKKNCASPRRTAQTRWRKRWRRSRRN